MLLSKFTIKGHSMEPFIGQNDTVLVSSIPYFFKDPKVKDIIVFRKKSDKYFIKRITKIKNGKYFVRGDNKKDSLDSRKLGLVQRSQIIAKFIYKI